MLDCPGGATEVQYLVPRVGLLVHVLHAEPESAERDSGVGTRPLYLRHGVLNLLMVRFAGMAERHCEVERTDEREAEFGHVENLVEVVERRPVLYRHADERLLVLGPDVVVGRPPATRAGIGEPPVARVAVVPEPGGADRSPDLLGRLDPRDEEVADAGVEGLPHEGGVGRRNPHQQFDLRRVGGPEQVVQSLAVPRTRPRVFEVEPDEVETEFAVELHERRTVRVVEDAERHVVAVEETAEAIRSR